MEYKQQLLAIADKVPSVNVDVFDVVVDLAEWHLLRGTAQRESALMQRLKEDLEVRLQTVDARRQDLVKGVNILALVWTEEEKYSRLTKFLQEHRLIMWTTDHGSGVKQLQFEDAFVECGSLVTAACLALLKMNANCFPDLEATLTDLLRKSKHFGWVFMSWTSGMF